MLDSKKFWIGIVVSVIFLALFVLTIDLRRMLEAVADANYVWLIPGVGLYLISVLFRTIRWRVLLHHMKPIGVRRLYPVVVVGYMANNLLPMRLGELVRSYYIGEREGISKTSSLVTIFVERVLDALTLLFFIAAIALFVPLSGLAEAFADRSGIPWPLLAAALSVPFIGAFITLVLFALLPEKTRAVSFRLLKPLPERFEAPLRHIIDMLLNGLMPMRDPKKLAVLFLLSVPIWLFETGLFVLTGFAFGLHNVYQSFGDLIIAMLLVTAIANIGSSIPAAPGGVGLFELIARETLVLLPLAVVDRSVAGAFSAVVHAALLIPMIVLGQVFLWSAHLSLTKLSRAGSEDQPKTRVISQGGADV